MTPARPTDHSIPATLDEVLRWTEADRARPGTPAATTVRLLVALLRLEAGARADTLKRLHAATVDAGGGPESPAWGALVAALGELLEHANYREIGGAELQEAFEEEAKEAVLAWAFLNAHGPASERALDERIERWIHERTGRHCDFEVDDALAKLARLGLAARAGETWTATAPDAAAAGLRARWDAAAG